MDYKENADTCLIAPLQNKFQVSLTAVWTILQCGEYLSAFNEPSFATVQMCTFKNTLSLLFQ
jgi:hypothetical protein